MTNYRNVFFNEEEKKLVGVDLDADDLIIEQEEVVGEAQEYDIKHGYINEKGYTTQPYDSASLLYEFHMESHRTEDDLAYNMVETPEIANNRRSVRSAFHVLFMNYLKTCPKDRGRTRGSMVRFWYNVSGGAITRYTRSSNGIRLESSLLTRNWGVDSERHANDILPNIYGGGDTCHWGLTELRRWRMDRGKRDNEPDTLAKCYELFKAGVGNNDLVSSNSTSSMTHRELIDIVTEFKAEYALKLEHEGMRRHMVAYIDRFVSEMRDEGLNDHTSLNANQLASILEHTPNFYIEDYM